MVAPTISAFFRRPPSGKPPILLFLISFGVSFNPYPRPVQKCDNFGKGELRFFELVGGRVDGVAFGPAEIRFAQVAPGEARAAERRALKACAHQLSVVKHRFAELAARKIEPVERHARKIAVLERASCQPRKRLHERAAPLQAAPGD